MQLTPRNVIFLSIVSAAILTGCDSCSKEKAEPAPTAATSTTAPADAAAPATDAATAPADQGTLQSTDLVEGSGAAAEDGKKLTVHYTGTLQDGTKFDSTVDRGPFSFVLGSGLVIAGWDQGIKGMKVGGKRKLIIPPHLAYGSRSVGGVIPPNSTLVFEIELLKVE
jgi:peptidylprolyl isomerase